MSNGNLSSVIQGEQSMLVLIPENPRFDEVAAGLSLYLAFQLQGKNVSVSTPTPMRVEFNRLVGVNRISTEIGGKNLLITFKDYDADGIEKVSWDLKNGEFQLTVVPKPEANPPQQKQIDLSYSGFAGGTVIMVGGTNEAHFPILSKEELKDSKLVHIGTREIQSSKQIISFARPAPAVSEVAADLIQEDLKIQMDADLATNLVMGIEEGSDNFQDERVSAKTFELVAELMRKGGKRAPRSDSQQHGGQNNVQQQPKQQQPQMYQGEQDKPQPQQQQPQIYQGAQGGQKQGQDDGDKDQPEKPPQSWFEPKIFKGTSTK